MYCSSIPSRPLPKPPQTRISAQKRQRPRFPSFTSQNQFLSSLIQLQQPKAQQSLKSLMQRDRVQFIGLVRRIEIREKILKEQTQIQAIEEQVVYRPGPTAMQRRRNQEKLTIRTKPVKKPKLAQNRALAVYYRYSLVSLCGLLGRREDYMASLRIKKVDTQLVPMPQVEIEERLKKQLDSKGRDRGRQNFNIFGSDQLRSLKFKKKQSYTSNSPSKGSNSGNNNKQDEQEGQEPEQAQYKQQKIDYATWRRRNGVRKDQKVFIIKSGYQDMRKALLDRGWFENEDVWSPFFDLKWTTKFYDIDFYGLASHQMVNHFNNNQGLISKFGLARNLRTLVLGHNIDVDKFFPRCYDLGDQQDFENFVENFKIGFAETVVRRFLVQPERYQNLELKVRLALQVLERRLRTLSESIDAINTLKYPMISPQDWTVLTQTHQLTQTQVLQKLKPYRKQDTDLDPTNQNYQKFLFQRFAERIKDALEKLKQLDPQIEMNGYHNIWIVKPNFLSRGRGIRCFNNLFDIVQYCFCKDIQYVAQKYIQNPLVVLDRKFDIRQWVLIQDFNPPKVWFYDQCYIRFCTQHYSLQNINNRYIHLTNNSIQKHNSKFNLSEIPGNMWSMEEFSNHVGEQRWKQIQKRMKDIVVWSIKSCEQTISARRNTCELVGYDFMIDEQYSPWLIEVNMSPAMDYSTHITKRLVKSVMQDTVKVIADSRKNRDTGMFRCIYRGEDTQNFETYKI